MNKEEQIIEMLGKIMDKQDKHTHILNEHSKKLREHRHILENHSCQLKEHGQILTALRAGQEHLKAGLDGMKISNAKDFGGLKEEVNTSLINLELLR